MIDFSRSTGMQMLDPNDFESYIKVLNQDNLERVLLVDNGKKLLYPFVAWYMKGGVLNLAVEHDRWVYEQWLLEEVPEEVIRHKFHVINEESFDMDTFMLSVDIKIRQAMRITPKYEDLFPKSYITHLKMNDGYVMHKLVNDFFDRLRKTYPNSPKTGFVAACYTTFYKWVQAYPNDIETVFRWIEKPRPKGYKYAPLQEFLSMRMYLNED